MPCDRWPASLLWTRADELSDAQAITGLLGIIVENGNLDQAKATALGFVRTCFPPGQSPQTAPQRSP